MAIFCTISISHGSVVVVVMDTNKGSEILQGEESEESQCPTEGSWWCGADFLFPPTDLISRLLKVNEMVQVGEGKAFAGN